MVPQLRDGLCIREVEGDAVILDRHHEMMHSFNPSAACILRAIDGKRTVEEISRVVVERFEVDERTAREDTRKILEQIEALGLLESVPSEPA